VDLLFGLLNLFGKLLKANTHGVLVYLIVVLR